VPGKFDLARIKELIDLVAGSGIAELEISEGDERLRILRGVAPAAAAAPEPPKPRPAPPPAPAASRTAAPETNADRVVTAPMHGIFHSRPAPDAAPFVTPGQEIAPGQKLCIIEAMKVFNAIEAAAAGRIAAILVEDGQEVEYGQPLIRLA